MKKEELRIIYMGTPDFAVEPLKRLVKSGYNIVGVITMPDKPIGRHQTELSASPVKKFALEHNLKVLQPAKLKDPEFIEELKALQADLQIVVAFRMLPEVVWAMPRFGTFNLHAALLPQYRGAAPINWAIINGEKQTGITTFFLDHDIDTGSVIQRVPVTISDTDNAEDVHDKLMVLGADLVVETVYNILNNKIQPIPQKEFQTDGPLHLAPKIYKNTCRIDWNKGVKKTYDFIRGLSPYPAAWTELHHNGKTSVLKIYNSTKEFCTVKEPIGNIVTDGKNYLKIAQCDGYQCLQCIQIAGKKRMDIKFFLRGFHAENDTVVN